MGSGVGVAVGSGVGVAVGSGVGTAGTAVAVGSGVVVGVGTDGEAVGVGAKVGVAMGPGPAVGVGRASHATSATIISVRQITASTDVSFVLIDFFSRLSLLVSLDSIGA